MCEHRFLDIILLIDEMANVYETNSNSIPVGLWYYHLLETGNMEQLMGLSVFDVDLSSFSRLNDTVDKLSEFYPNDCRQS